MASSAKHFINDPDQLVNAALQAVTLTNPAVALDAEHKIIYRRPSPHGPSPQQVSLVSGGGSGHEPSFASMVGPGLLSAAVAGTIFASPSAEQVRTAIMGRIDHHHRRGGSSGSGSGSAGPGSPQAARSLVRRAHATTPPALVHPRPPPSTVRRLFSARRSHLYVCTYTPRAASEPLCAPRAIQFRSPQQPHTHTRGAGGGTRSALDLGTNRGGEVARWVLH